MLPVPRTPAMNLSGSASVMKGFVRVREVSGGVVGLHLGRNTYDYRGVMKINTINFALMSEDDQDALIESFKTFLNGLSFSVQILIKNRPYRLDDYITSLQEADGELAAIARDHANFVRQLASKRALVKRDFYLIVPSDAITTRNRAEASASAQTQLRLRIDGLMRQLERLGLAAQRLGDKEIIALYQSSFISQDSKLLPLSDPLIEGANGLMQAERISAPLSGDLSYSDSLQESGIAQEKESRTQKRAAKKQPKRQEKLPTLGSVPELISPSSIQIFPWYLRMDGESGQEYSRTLAFTNYPRSAYPGWLDSIIQLDEPFVDFSIHIKPLPPAEVSARLGKKAVEFRGSVIASARQGKMADPTSTIALRDIETLREKLARGDERVFSLSLFIQVRARTLRELSERNNRLSAAIRSLDFRALPAHWQHHAGFLSCLPEDDNQLGHSRLFGTSSAATFYPFTSSDISMDNGIMFGIHPNGNLIILNPFNSAELENANLVVFAKSGAGKSFFLKTVSCRLLPTCNVYVIDPEAEYGALCQHVSGQYVRLSSESLQINPFELHTQTGKATASGQEEGNFFREKLLNLTTLFELLLSDDGTLTQKEKAFLYRCLVKTYENRGISMDPSTHGRQVPNMQEFFVIMSSASRGDHRFGLAEDSFGLSERLERYLHLFPSRTRVELDNRFVDFSIRELNDALKPIGLFLIAEFLWTKMRQARQALVPTKNTIVLIDEAWLLMQFRQGARFLAEFARRIRKYGGGLWCTTQNSDDFLSSEEGRTILAMATMKFLMKQDATTIDSVIHTFRLSAGQRNFLLAAKRGEGLFATKLWTPMEVVASPKEMEIANTTITTTAAPSSGADEILEELEIVADMQHGVDSPSVNGHSAAPLTGLASNWQAPEKPKN